MDACMFINTLIYKDTACMGVLWFSLLFLFRSYTVPTN